MNHDNTNKGCIRRDKPTRTKDTPKNAFKKIVSLVDREYTRSMHSLF
uniref:Uncharacterized protein n=1 Tax=Arundo donax TaxID=35708 RepID=A0A0A9FIP1_ARUDO